MPAKTTESTENDMEGNAAWLLDVLLMVVAGGLSWWNKTMWAEIKELRRNSHAQAGEVNKLQVLMVGSYVTREELRDSMREMTATVTNRIDRMSDKMDSQLAGLYDELKHKVDKP